MATLPKIITPTKTVVYIFALLAASSYAVAKVSVNQHDEKHFALPPKNPVNMKMKVSCLIESENL